MNALDDYPSIIMLPTAPPESDNPTEGEAMCP
jgi:hypothetical protein